MRCLEFYSGLGGMHYALKESFPAAEVVCAFDINVVANDVYQHNHGKRPYQGNIEKLSVKQLEGYRADLWLLAPPCQPYTRRGLQKDADDWRATSFMNLLLKLPQMQVPPSHLLVENVVGFEQSRTRAHMVKTMQAAGYAIQEFVISPVQLGIPYSRPRYFAVMKQTHNQSTATAAVFPLQGLMDGAPFTDPPSVLMQRLNHPGAVSTAQSVVLEQPVRNFLEVALPSDAATQQEATDVVGESQLGTEPMPEGEAQEDVQEDDLSYNVPKDVLVKWGHVIDIVTPDSCMTNCFTKTYTRFAKGCGSVLATQNLDSISFELSTQQRCSSSQAFIKPRLIARPLQAKHLPAGGCVAQQLPEVAHVSTPAAKLTQQGDRPAPDSHGIVSAQGTSHQAANSHGAGCDTEHAGQASLQEAAVESDGVGYDGQREAAALLCWLEGLQLRYFMPREAANLHSFPDSFSFPVHVTRRQQYALLGNSLSVAVVADLLTYMLKV